MAINNLKIMHPEVMQTVEDMEYVIDMLFDDSEGDAAAEDEDEIRWAYEDEKEMETDL